MWAKQKVAPEIRENRWSFASVAQLLLIIALTISFIMITQRRSEEVYSYGVMALIVLTLFQIAFGNIPPNANWKTSIIGVVIAAAIIGAVIRMSIWLTPYLLQLGR